MRIALVSSAGAAALLLAGAAQAQAPDQTQSRTDQSDAAIPTVVVTDESRASTAYNYGAPINSGETTFGADSVRDRAPGSGDGNQLLKLAPTVQFSMSEGMADNESLQDIRPAQISISGASGLDNLYILDGVGVTSQLDTFSGDPDHYDEVGAASAQAIWVDSSLIGEITLLDSNVSAEYGGFLGGVLDVKTRAPSSAFGFTAYYGATETDMASYRIPDNARERLAGAYPDKPQYEKSRYGFTIDLPVAERFNLLAGYSYSDSTVTYYRNATYGGSAFGQISKSEQYLLKGEYDLADHLKLDGQITWSPYESMNANANGIDNQMYQHGGGLASSLKLEGSRGEADWSIQISYLDSDNDRDAPTPNYSIPSSASGWCSSTNCTRGSFGDLEQRQQNYGLKTSWSQPLAGGDLRLGFDFTQTDAARNRPEDNRAYSRGATGSDIKCLYPEEAAALTCVPGSYALTTYFVYPSYFNEVQLQRYDLWGEYSFDWNGFDVRAGLRYGFESFLENHNFAPRLSVARLLPWAGTTLTVGLNRYYSNSFLGYALRENSVANYTYKREAVRGVYGNWVLSAYSSPIKYSNLDLKTPYSDEFTVAAQGRMLGGRYRIKGILREAEDQITRVEVSERYTTPIGTTATRRTSTPTNDGHSSYRGLSLEWTRDFGRHTISANTNISKTKTSAIDYFTQSDDTLYGDEIVYYNGELRSLIEVVSENQREDFASPLVINADWAATWLGDRVRTNVNARYRDEFQRVEDLGTTTTVDGARYDTWGVVTYDPSVDVNLSIQAEIARTQYGTTTLDLRVNNLFDTIRNNNSTSTSQPYQLGRNLWVSLKYQY
ncbi:TonB-dependent receptor plug domain-containing protein [Brevundimonas mediterranea]|uniref:TonB-dependent receptor n=1 Tax=Brevundimonas mediterranea TaxID=74329 RepID=A0A7W6A4R7_9CAUL|nr:TonB-dependent receptor plug domain-containing protein [Brevundimonas mediterranea]MBB3871700.1 hypothetical protein [Brevundimonas mediterranea]